MGRLPKPKSSGTPTGNSTEHQGSTSFSEPTSFTENLNGHVRSAEGISLPDPNSPGLAKHISAGANLNASEANTQKDRYITEGEYLSKRPPPLNMSSNSMMAASGESPLKKILPELGSAQKLSSNKVPYSPETKIFRASWKADIEEDNYGEDDDVEELIRMEAKKKQVQLNNSVSRSSSQTQLVVPVQHLGFSSEDLVQDQAGQIQEKYYFKSKLGSGNFGIVYQAEHKITRVVRAVKKIRKPSQKSKPNDSLLKDVDILKKLDHPNIIKVYEFYQDESWYYIVTDLCSGGELFQKILTEKCFTEGRAADLFKQMLSAINYCHDKRLVHCDLKPENILFESANSIGQNSNLIKIIDFGNSTFCKPNDKLTSKFGSAYYVAPEVLKGSYTEKCDIWSLGVILYVMLCGKPPFNGPNEQAILTRIVQGKYLMDGPDWEGVSFQAKDLISKMLTHDYTKRPSAKQCLEHNWFGCFQHGWEEEAKLSTQVGRRALRNLRGFQAESQLQEAILYYITNQLASKEEREDLMNTFLTLDKDNDGKLTKSDLIQVYIKMGEDPQTVEQTVSDIISKIDKQDKGFIDYSEFVTASLSKRRLMTEDRLQAAFLLFGGDKEGVISAENFKSVLCKGVFASVDESLWQGLIANVADDSGEIRFQNFKNMMQLFANNEQITQSLAR